MTLEELNNRIREEYALFRYFAYLYDFGESDREKVGKELRKHLREYKNLTGNDFQLE